MDQMRGRSRVVGPDGVAWTVWRRWFAWRRALGLREVWFSSTATSDEQDPQPEQADHPLLLRVLGIVLWLVIGAGKAVLIAVAVVLVVAASTVDIVLQLLVLPVVVLARVAGLASWPVQIERANLHVRTEHARGFAEAGALRDGLVAQIRAGHDPG